MILSSIWHKNEIKIVANSYDIYYSAINFLVIEGGGRLQNVKLDSWTHLCNRICSGYVIGNREFIDSSQK